jgi:hypothetical protein
VWSRDSQHRPVAPACEEHCCEPLGKQGARGALFKITLASHGYTFVGKGTVEAFVPDLRHEGQVYERLEGKLVSFYHNEHKDTVTFFIRGLGEIERQIVIVPGHDLPICGNYLRMLQWEEIEEQIMAIHIQAGDK